MDTTPWQSLAVIAGIVWVALMTRWVIPALLDRSDRHDRSATFRAARAQTRDEWKEQ